MFRHILAPLSPSMDTPLALAVGASLARGGEMPLVSVAPLAPLQQAVSAEEARREGGERIAGTGTVGAAAADRQVDLIIVTPKNRELSEIEWYPHTAAWSLLRLRTPLLFWPPEAPAASLLAASKPMIAVPLDGHAHAEQAIPFACALAEAYGGEVTLLRVLPPTHSERQLRKAPPTLRGKRVARVHEVLSYLRAVRDRAAAQTSTTITTKILLGEPGSALVHFARRHGVGIVVMTTHSQARGGRFFAGAVATQVLRQSPAPTLLIPLGAETEPSQNIHYESFIPVTP